LFYRSAKVFAPKNARWFNYTVYLKTKGFYVRIIINNSKFFRMKFRKSVKQP